MDFFFAAVLGIVQGLSEFLPISSSAHLSIFNQFFKLNLNATQTLSFFVILHTASLFAIMFVFRTDIRRLAASIFPAAKKIITLDLKNLRFYEKLNALIFIGTIPAALIGLLFDKIIEGIFSDFLFVGTFMLITSFLLWYASKIKTADLGLRKIGVVKTLIIGLSQAAAIFPGISRSGATITTGIFLKTDPEIAVRFSFLLAIPVIAGATVLKIKHVVGGDLHFVMICFIGFCFSFIASFAALKALIKLARLNKWNIFAAYMFIAGLLVIAYGIY